MPVKSLDDLMESSNGDSSNATTNNSDDDGTDELREACEAIGASVESARDYIDKHGSRDDLIEFAQELAENDELWETLVQYRQMHDRHRFVTNYLRPMNADFTVFTGQFYGDTDDPEPGTYNHVQQKSRDLGGNLAYYKALFPEPLAEMWNSDPVLWVERPNDDTHIYVPESFVEEFSDFTTEIGGREVPRPPSDAEIEAMQSDSGSSESAGDEVMAPFNPASYTVDTVRDKLKSDNGGVAYTMDELEGLLASEERRDDRKTAKRHIERAMKKLRKNSDDEPEQQSLDQASEDDESGGGSVEETVAATAGRIVGKHGLDAKPDHIEGMLAEGMSEEQIVAIYE